MTADAKMRKHSHSTPHRSPAHPLPEVSAAQNVAPDSAAVMPAPSLAAAPAEAPLGNSRRTEKVLVLGLGDEAYGDSGVGCHLARCLADMDWPPGVRFELAANVLPEHLAGYEKIVLLQAMNGPNCPGSLYHADAEALVALASTSQAVRMDLLRMIAPPLRQRLMVLGVHPRTTQRDSGLSEEILVAIPRLLPYLRSFILRCAKDISETN
jgi:hydrogenase maturation protease